MFRRIIVVVALIVMWPMAAAAHGITFTETGTAQLEGYFFNGRLSAFDGSGNFITAMMIMPTPYTSTFVFDDVGDLDFDRAGSYGGPVHASIDLGPNGVWVVPSIIPFYPVPAGTFSWDGAGNFFDITAIGGSMGYIRQSFFQFGTCPSHFYPCGFYDIASISAAVAPGPIAGAGIPGLGLGIVVLLWRTRRR